LPQGRLIGVVPSNPSILFALRSRHGQHLERCCFLELPIIIYIFITVNV
jgi:hypothetical protein